MWKRILTAALLGMPLSAETISWGSSPFARNLTSSGDELSADWTFELGYFATGFLPTNGNTEEWGEQWRTLDVAAYSEATRRFVGVWTDTGEAPDGSRGYIWGYNRGSSAPEWILLRADSWTFPLPMSGDSLDPSSGERWTVATSNQVVVGTVENAGIHMRTEAVTGGPPLLCSEDWRRLVFLPEELEDPATSGWEADPDQDGNSNLVEFAFGLRPKVPDQVTTRVFLQDGFFEFEVQRAENVKVNYFGSVSPDLMDWFEDEESVALVDARPATLRYRYLRPIDSVPKHFGQVRVALRP